MRMIIRFYNTFVLQELYFPRNQTLNLEYLFIDDRYSSTKKRFKLSVDMLVKQSIQKKAFWGEAIRPKNPDYFGICIFDISRDCRMLILIFWLWVSSTAVTGRKTTIFCSVSFDCV